MTIDRQNCADDLVVSLFDWWWVFVCLCVYAFVRVFVRKILVCQYWILVPCTHTYALCLHA